MARLCVKMMVNEWVGIELTVEYMKFLLKIHEEQSISKAAVALHMSQSALTQIVHRLEEELSCVLFERSNRGVKTTSYGDIVIEYARALVDSHAAMTDKLAQMKNETVSVVIKHCCSLTNDVMPQVFYQIQNAHPTVKIEVGILEKSKMLREIEQGGCDFGFAMGDVRTAQTLAVTHLGAERFGLIAARNHPVPSRIALREVISLRMIEFTTGSYMKLFRNALQIKRDAEPDIAEFRPFMRLDSLSSIKSLLQKNVGVSFLPLSAVVQELENGSLRIVDLSDFDLTLDIKLVAKPDHLLTEELRRIKNNLVFLTEAYLLRSQIC